MGVSDGKGWCCRWWWTEERDGDVDGGGGGWRASDIDVISGIRSGGHDYDGLSYVSEVPFVILDMFNLRSISVDIEDETAWVESGATLGELYYKIVEKSKIHGFPVGVCPTVGVGGHFSGGGYGNIMRKYGLSVDNVVDAYIVDVNGRVRSRETMGDDLFWAIKGGGGASFGVVLVSLFHGKLS
ncbi:hypothetical protein F0562_013564 [Nyssa sinensis]|uniref:FAD-binding PCMH-type domain-containing protein n=1 Tax=Nyssa sinensis TaxID=561372 RepID=A0A5J4ZNS6_9ASTE|nr:hypothetical protein F0562_013564 [Nyssa sinensis]